MNLKKFNKQNKLILLVLLIVGISIGYAALSSTLNINGNANIKTAKWDIHFENLVKTTGSATATKEAVINTAKTLIEYTVTLEKPGDFYDFTMDVVNAGSIDAMISKIVKTGLDVSQSKYIAYTVTYSNGLEVSEKDKLSAGEKKNIKVRVKYRDSLNPEELPTEDKAITLTFQLVYVQADETAKDVIPIFPKYFAFGEPTTSSTTDYITLGKNVFNVLGLDGSTGVCINDNGLFCLKTKNFENTKEQMKEHFGESNCSVNDSKFYCYFNYFDCNADSGGTVSCGDYKAGKYCVAYAFGTFNCE